MGSQQSGTRLIQELSLLRPSWGGILHHTLIPGYLGFEGSIPTDFPPQNWLESP